jgi:hypothetical protein
LLIFPWQSRLILAEGLPNLRPYIDLPIWFTKFTNNLAYPQSTLGLPEVLMNIPPTFGIHVSHLLWQDAPMWQRLNSMKARRIVGGASQA